MAAVTRADLLVVGGGPAGAATAAHAARAGLKVLLVERDRFPRDKACAECLSPEAARDLDDLGVLARVEAAGAVRVSGFRMVSDDGVAVVGRYARGGAFQPYRPFGYALSRRRLDAILLDAAREAGAEVQEGVALDRLEVERDAVVGASLRPLRPGRASAGGATAVVRAAAVVGADGLTSRVARQLGLAGAGAPRRLALVAHLEGVRGTSDLGEMFAARGRYLGLAPIGGGLTNVAAVVPMDDAPAIAADAEGFFRRQLAAWPELAARTAGARVARRVLVTGPFARRSRRATADGALLVGDAADFFDPFTGEGMFAALRGGRLAAHALVAALARGAATRAALAPYAAARRRAFLGKWILERLVGLGATRPFLMRRFTHHLARRPDVADLWVGAAGDSVPVRALFAPGPLAALL